MLSDCGRHHLLELWLTVLGQSGVSKLVSFLLFNKQLTYWCEHGMHVSESHLFCALLLNLDWLSNIETGKCHAPRQHTHMYTRTVWPPEYINHSECVFFFAVRRTSSTNRSLCYRYSMKNACRSPLDQFLLCHFLSLLGSVFCLHVLIA